MMDRLRGVGTLLMLTLIAARGQTAPARPSFEAATIRIAEPARGGGRFTVTGDRVVLNHTTLLNALARAFGLNFPSQVAGPSWIFSERYDIVAKAPDHTAKDQILPMLQNLLVDRFQLSLHHETRDLKGYALIAGKSALKIQEVKDPATKNDWELKANRREAKGMTMAALSSFLSPMLQAPVIEMTGLAGYYDFPLEPTMEETRLDSAPSVFTVVDQLGLKLESRQIPLDVIVIDRGNKAPTEN